MSADQRATRCTKYSIKHCSYFVGACIPGSTVRIMAFILIPAPVYCLDHRSYIKHQCTKVNKQDVTVVICPLCAKSVRLIPDQDPNITWEHHVNIDCDPSNFEKVTKKKKCPAAGCREILVFSDTIKCRDCMVDHCLKHHFGPDHKCPVPTNIN